MLVFRLVRRSEWAFRVIGVMDLGKVRWKGCFAQIVWMG